MKRIFFIVTVGLLNISFGDFQQLGNDITRDEFNQNFGSSVAINSDGTIIAIGGPTRANQNYGAVYLYEWNGSSWDQMGDDIIGDSAGESLGKSVALSSDGSIVAIGSPHYSPNTGSVILYRWSGSSWNQIGNRINGTIEGGLFGDSISLNSDGTIVAIGSPKSGNNFGSTMIYEWNGSS